MVPLEYPSLVLAAWIWAARRAACVRFCPRTSVDNGRRNIAPPSARDRVRERRGAANSSVGGAGEALRRVS